jgi:hypothetical protein
MAEEIHKVITSENVVNAALASQATGAASAMIIHGLSLPEWASLISVGVAIAGFLLQLFVTIRKISIEDRERRDRLAMFQRPPSPKGSPTNDSDSGRGGP